MPILPVGAMLLSASGGEEGGKCLARFTAGAPDHDAGLALVPDASVSRLRRDGDVFLHIEPSGRHYEEDAIGFRIGLEAVRQRGAIVVEAEYLDEGYGLMTASRLVDPAYRGEWVNARRCAGSARLNTGQLRTVAFEFDRGSVKPGASDKADLLITGVQNLRELRILESADAGYWAGLQKRIPQDVAPALALSRPMQVVCSAGIQVLGGRGDLEASLENLREQLPLAKALGFNAIEAYVRWDIVEPEEGRFDWSFYDAVVAELRRYGLQLFPLLIVGSAYTLPEWFYRSPENVGFVCLEHGLGNSIQSIWSPYHRRHVTRFLQAFGAHYEPMGCLQGVRLGPSGNYGESQYPASGDWGHGGSKMHIHIGMWAGDPYAEEDFRRWVRAKYGSSESLREAWNEAVTSFEDVRPILPEQCVSKRQRIDLYSWYTDSMSDWCEWWAVEARKAMPNTPIYQSAGGWGAAEIGTDYTAQAKSMVGVKGGIRVTNELDSFHQCVYATRLAATAARHYGIPLGFEPAMGHTGRGTAGRLFNCVSNNGEHFFIYGGNIFNRQSSIANWLRHYRLFDLRQAPVVEVALYYPQTMNFLSQDGFRYLNAWGFNPYAREIRNRIEVDYLDDRLIEDGFLEQYQALVFCWGDQVEGEALAAVDRWLRKGRMVIFPCFLGAVLTTVEGDNATFRRWMLGDTDAGRFCRYQGDDEPPELYADFVRSALLETTALSPITRVALEAQRPDKVFLSAQADGRLLILNFGDAPATVTHHALGSVEIAPYTIERVKVCTERKAI